MSKREDRHVHIMGIGGAGMSGIARIMVAQGVQVSGCDARDSRRLEALRMLGVACAVGHDAAHVVDAHGHAAVDELVVSTAIPTEHPERLAAQLAGLPVRSRADALAGVMAGSRGVAVAGTHGKTTTTSMLTVALQHCGADPSFAIGSELNESGSNAHQGSGDIFVVEADESDGAFLRLPAVAGIVTNVEPDHLNYWGTFDRIEDAFVQFARGIGDNDGFVAVCLDDPGARRLTERATAAGVDMRSYGAAEDARYRIVDERPAQRGWTFTIEDATAGIRWPLTLQVPGRHNALNATAAFVVAVGLGFSPEQVVEGLAGFTGTRRRFDFKGEINGVRVFDDYAHHPTEIAATLRAARDVVGDGRLVVAFQAHHYYRTAMFIEEFGAALGLADDVVVLEVFAPGEVPIPGASGQTMAANVPLKPEHVVFEPSWSAVAAHLADRAGEGDIIMTLGAGDIGMIGIEVLDLLAMRQVSE